MADQAREAYVELAEQLSAGDPVPCRVTSDPEAWWPERANEGPRVAAAVAACRACRVRTACLGYAVAAGEVHGVWGGLTPVERAAGREGGRS